MNYYIRYALLYKLVLEIVLCKLTEIKFSNFINSVNFFYFIRPFHKKPQKADVKNNWRLSIPPETYKILIKVTTE